MAPSTRLKLTVVVLGAVLALAGCTPTPVDAEPEPTPSATETPTPTPSATEEPQAPTVNELAITPNGMGTLVIGQAPSSVPPTQMLEQDPAACADENTGFGAGVEPGDPEAIRWVPIEEYNVPDGHPHWSVDVHDGVLNRIDVRDGSVPTDRGIRIGDPAAAALAAYPDAAIVEEWGTRILVLPGTSGVLHLEIAHDPMDIPGYWGDLVDTVVYLRAVDLTGGVFSVAASENIAGGCI